MSYHSLKIRFLTIVLLTAVIPLLLVLSFSYFRTVRMTQEFTAIDIRRSLERFQFMVTAIHEEQIRTAQMIIESMWTHARSISGQNYSIAKDEKSIQILIDFLANRLNIFDSALWADMNGHPAAKFIWLTDVASQRFREVFVETRHFTPEDSNLARKRKFLKSNEVDFLPPSISKTGFMQFMKLPICSSDYTEKNDQHLGNLSIALRLDFLFNEATKRAQIPFDQTPIVVDTKGTILYHPEQKNICQKLNLIHPELNIMMKTHLKSPHEMLWQKHKDWFLACSPQEHWILVLASQQPTLIAKSRPIYLINGVLILLTLALAACLLMFSMNKVSRSLAEVAAGANAIAQGDLNKRLLIRSADEIGILSRAFNTMADSLETMIQERVEKEKLKELNELKSAFVSLVSHELRQPLGHILIAAENMRKGIGGNLSEKQSQYLDKVKSNTVTLIHMIQELLDLSRIEAARIELDLTPVPINSLITAVIDESSHLWQEKALFVQHCPAQVEISIQADREKVKEILSNLLDNAIKYTPQKGRITITATKEADKVEIVVADTGIGISPDHLVHIFDRFYQVKDDRLQRNHGGLGLGLSIVKSFVELHLGSIHIESIVAKGTKVFVRLPLSQQKDADD